MKCSNQFDTEIQNDSSSIHLKSGNFLSQFKSFEYEDKAPLDPTQRKEKPSMLKEEQN